MVLAPLNIQLLLPVDFVRPSSDALDLIPRQEYWTSERCCALKDIRCLVCHECAREHSLCLISSYLTDSFMDMQYQRNV